MKFSTPPRFGLVWFICLWGMKSQREKTLNNDFFTLKKKLSCFLLILIKFNFFSFVFTFNFKTVLKYEKYIISMIGQLLHLPYIRYPANETRYSVQPYLNYEYTITVRGQMYKFKERVSLPCS